jgi:hypothetical protein
MTEEEWLSSEDATLLFRHLDDGWQMPGRQRALIAAAACRVVASHGREATVLGRVAEMFERRATLGRTSDIPGQPASLAFDSLDFQLELTPEESLDMAAAIREIVGNPFSPITPEPAWAEPVVQDLARRIEAGRDFAGLPVLADALEEAGCLSEEMLSHLRCGGPHNFGCWALGRVLGTS